MSAVNAELTAGVKEPAHHRPLQQDRLAPATAKSPDHGGGVGVDGQGEGGLGRVGPSSRGSVGG